MDGARPLAMQAPCEAAHVALVLRGLLDHGEVVLRHVLLRFVVWPVRCYPQRTIRCPLRQLAQSCFEAAVQGRLDLGADLK
eukprot:scaffold11036_cov120-Isochrysis_galbana.AAC.4